jgi:hypothetical protein
MNRIVLVLCLAACGPLEPMEAGSTASTEQPIVNGNVRTDTTFGGALVEAVGPNGPTTCSGAFVANDLVLTEARCSGATGVFVSGLRSPVKLVRPTAHPTVVAVQLRKPVPGVTVLRVTMQRVTSGETLSCFGFDAQRTFTSGTFVVRDLSGDFLFLAGGMGFNGSFGVAGSDDGGFCLRDSTFELAAVLTRGTSGAARAVQADLQAGWLADVLVAVAQARSRTSLSLVHDPNAPSPLTLTAPGRALQPALRQSGSLAQGFYLAPVVAGRPEVVALVSAESGQCVVVSRGLLGFPGRAGLTRCNFASSAQWFVQTSHAKAFTGNLTTGYRLESPFTPGECLSATGASVLMPCGRVGSTVGFWLNLF